MIIILLTWVVIAVFAYLIARAVRPIRRSACRKPSGPVNFEIVVAVLIGWWIYKTQGVGLLWPSIIGGDVSLYVVVFVCARPPGVGHAPRRSAALDRGHRRARHMDRPSCWSTRFIASVLPVRIAACSRATTSTATSSSWGSVRC